PSRSTNRRLGLGSGCADWWEERILLATCGCGCGG
uniref:Uncharacterized protein n=1 Tax=Aegilops tauschii subsp. strangulata TaxID=200361 RepID=A0A453MMH6_AEGTS